MIISDLNHIEVVSTQESSIKGAGGKSYKPQFAVALAGASADAIGVNFAGTATNTATVAIYGGGAAASSRSVSGSIAG